MPRVSVILPTYNYAHFLPEALDSILGQTYQDLEIIVVDDGSTNGTADVMASYRECHPDKVIYLPQPHRGLSATRNAGLARASAPYVAFLDADDVWLPEKLEKQVAIMEAHPDVGLVHGDAVFVDADGHRLGLLPREKLPAIGWMFERLIIGNFIIVTTVMARRDLVNQVGGFDESLNAAEDWDLELRLARIARVAYLNQTLTRYRVHGSNLHKNVERNDLGCLAVLDKAFADETLPAHTRALRRRAYSGAHVESARRYLRAGDTGRARDRLHKAIRLHPAMLAYRDTAVLYFACLLGDRGFSLARAWRLRLRGFNLLSHAQRHG